jgi:hypothetical protein
MDKNTCSICCNKTRENTMNIIHGKKKFEILIHIVVFTFPLNKHNILNGPERESVGFQTS